MFQVYLEIFMLIEFGIWYVFFFVDNVFIVLLQEYVYEIVILKKFYYLNIVVLYEVVFNIYLCMD